MIQRTRKKAIIAVMKSAKAIFQAPPWCPSSWLEWRLMMMIWGGWSAMGQSWSTIKAIDRAEYEHLRLSKWAARSCSLDGSRGDRLGYRRKRVLAAALLARKLAWALTLSAGRPSRRFRRRRTFGRGCGASAVQAPRQNARRRHPISRALGVTEPGEPNCRRLDDIAQSAR